MQKNVKHFPIQTKTYQFLMVDNIMVFFFLMHNKVVLMVSSYKENKAKLHNHP